MSGPKTRILLYMTALAVLLTGCAGAGAVPYTGPTSGPAPPEVYAEIATVEDCDDLDALYEIGVEAYIDAIASGRRELADRREHVLQALSVRGEDLGCG